MDPRGAGTNARMAGISMTDRLTLEIVSTVTEELGRLPAVATLDWCDEAAQCMTRIAEPAYVMLVVATVGPDGDISRQEACGAAGPSSLAARGDLASRHLVGGLRAGADRLRHIGWRPSPQSIARGMCGPATALNGGRDWRTGPCGPLWNGVGVSDVACGIYPLGDAYPGRSVIVQIGTMNPEPALLARRTDLLSVLLPALARRTLVALGDQPTVSGRWLTSREQQVLRELTVGRSVREIADGLGRSPHTVHDHVKSLHRKLGASSRGELIARALGHLTQRISLPTDPAGTPFDAVPEGSPKPNQAGVPSEHPFAEQNETIGGPRQARPLGQTVGAQPSQSGQQTLGERMVDPRHQRATPLARYDDNR